MLPPMRHRPLALWVVVILQVVLGISLLAGAAGREEIFSSVGEAMTDVARAAFLVSGLLVIGAALWLFSLSRRGWVLTMVFVGVGLLANLVLWYLGTPSYLRMAVQAATALYLNSAPIRELFVRHDEVSTIPIRESELT
jgi:hypothetical protein